MKIKDGFLLQDVAGNTVVLPAEGDLDMMITLNETAKFLWERLEQETTREALIEALLAAYEDVDADTAAECVDNFVAELKKNDFLA